jgi:hypothetical protein
LRVFIHLEELEELLQGYAELNSWSEKPVALVLAWYLRALSDAEIAQCVHQLVKEDQGFERTTGRTLRELLERLGEAPAAAPTS